MTRRASMDGPHPEDCPCANCILEVYSAFTGMIPNRRCRQCGSIFVWHMCGGMPR
jgi:hypothetical protein